MSLGELYQQDVDRSLSTMAAIPPDPPKREERSAWSAPWRIVKSAAAGVLGTVADVAKGYGAAALIADEANPVARAALGDAAVRRGGDEGRAAIASGEATVSEFGDSLRALRTEFRPDPLTASKAEQTVFGIGEGLLKIGGAALAGGPIGVGLMSAQMGAEHADDLRGQGVDPVTRTKVGLLTGAVTGVSVALPAWGSSLGRTAAWWAAGGTATVAQTALTREILQRADYARLAEQYDPLDPLQLALAYGMPAPFAGYGAWRNLRAARGSNATARPEAAPPAVAPEVVDAAMTHNLTVQQDVHEAGVVRPETAQIPRAGALQPVDRVIENRLAGLLEDRAPTQADVTAAAVERMRTLSDEQITDTPAPLNKPSTDPLLASIADRVSAVEATAGDMVVRTDEAGRPVTVADELARIRREAAEGTDAELGALDADLVRVAAECALSMGST